MKGGGDLLARASSTYDVALSVGYELALAAIQKNEPVPPGVLYDYASANLNVERRHDNQTARFHDTICGFIRRIHHQISLRFVPLGLQDYLRA